VGEIVGELAGGGVGPVEVFDDEEQRMPLGKRAEQTDDGLEEAQLVPVPTLVDTPAGVREELGEQAGQLPLQTRFEPLPDASDSHACASTGSRPVAVSPAAIVTTASVVPTTIQVRERIVAVGAWEQGLGAGLGSRAWEQGLGSGLGIRAWDQGLGSGLEPQLALALLEGLDVVL